MRKAWGEVALAHGDALRESIKMITQNAPSNPTLFQWTNKEAPVFIAEPSEWATVPASFHSLDVIDHEYPTGDKAYRIGRFIAVNRASLGESKRWDLITTWGEVKDGRSFNSFDEVMQHIKSVYRGEVEEQALWAKYGLRSPSFHVYGSRSAKTLQARPKIRTMFRAFTGLNAPELPRHIALLLAGTALVNAPRFTAYRQGKEWFRHPYYAENKPLRKICMALREDVKDAAAVYAYGSQAHFDEVYFGRQDLALVAKACRVLYVQSSREHEVEVVF